MTAFFADIAGSTRITEETGDFGARDILSTCLDLMDEIVRERGGRVSRRIGDELLCLFPTAELAAFAAADLHAAVSGGHRKGQLSRPMRLRIGFEHGAIVEDGGELYGQTVHTAARLASLAKAGQTLVTKGTLERINPVLANFARHFDSVVLKGLSGEQEVYDLPWSSDAATRVTKRRAPKKVGAAAVELEYGSETYRIDARRPRVEIGRDAACDLQVAGDSVSMIHARIIWNRGRVRLEDISTNGTTIRREDAPPLTLHRETALLLGSGSLWFGSAEDETEAHVRFRCCEADG
ncbi:MAG: FHA domain-containing protein [Planctomycetota bacterium]